MRLDDLPESSNVSDQRGMRTAGGIAAGGGGLLLLILGLIFGVDTSRLGYNNQVRQGDNQASVRLELQADYLAGVWAHEGQKQFNFIEAGDVESAIKSAQAIGDDRLQKRSGGFVHPEKFTHGTSRQQT